VPVTLSWEVQCAKQLLLNNNLVTGQSKSFLINGTTSYTLEATGYNGPVYAEAGVAVAPVNLTVSVDGEKISISFNANPGTYKISTLVCWKFGDSNPAEITLPQAQVKIDDFGIQQFSQMFKAGPLAPFSKIIHVQVNLSGFPSGPITGTWVRPK
jgi:hypothetical protein